MINKSIVKFETVYDTNNFTSIKNLYYSYQHVCRFDRTLWWVLWSQEEVGCWYLVISSKLSTYKIFLKSFLHFLLSQLPKKKKKKSVLRIIENCSRLSLSDIWQYTLIIVTDIFIFLPSHWTVKINDLSTVDKQIIGYFVQLKLYLFF